MTCTLPLPGRRSLARIFRSVVLPLPLRPATATSPVPAVKERFEKRGGPEKDFESSRASIVVASTASRDDSRFHPPERTLLERGKSVLYDPARFGISSRLRRPAVHGRRRTAVAKLKETPSSRSHGMLKRSLVLLLAGAA